LAAITFHGMHPLTKNYIGRAGNDETMSSRAALALMVMALMLAPTSLVLGAALSGAQASVSSDSAQTDTWSDNLPGVLAARNAHTWVSGFPLLKMGYKLERAGGSEEGGADGRAMELKYTGEHCRILVDSACKPYPSNATIGAVSNEFDTVIFPNNTATFGAVAYPFIDIKIVNVDGPYGIGGYFTPGDPGSVYIDCADITSWGYAIAAHEFQHLIHNQKDPDEELWLNEGCADVAIAVCYGQNEGTLTGHVDAFESYPDNDLTVFQNEIYDYGSAYAFVQYFWDHFGGQDTIRLLVSENGNGISGIDNVLKTLGYSKRFSQLFPEWCVACRVNDRTIDGGEYGFDILKISVQLAGDWSNLPVYSGGSVQRWAADCYRFRNGDGEDLEVNLCVTSGSYLPCLFALGSGRPSTVQKLGVFNSVATGLVRGFGRDFSEAILVTAASASGSYNYNASLVDRTAPVTSIMVNPERPNGNGSWYVTSPLVKLNVNEPSRTVYRWDDSPEQDYFGELTAPEGNHTIHYYSVDVNYNLEAAQNFTIAVDTTRPETGIEVMPAQPDGLGDWYITAPTIQLLTEENSTASYSWDGGNESNFTDAISVPEGTHALSYNSVDQAGNEGEGHTRTFRVDTSAPAAKADMAPASPDGLGGWYRSPPVITLSSEEKGAMLLYAWDNSTETAYIQPLVAPQGSHRLYYRARDQAGNAGARQDFSVKVDSVVPVSTLVVEPKSPEKGKEWYRVRPVVQIQVSDADTSASAYFSWDGESFRAYVGPLKVPEGEHTLHYYSKDTRGNVENASFRTFKVDTVAPVTKMTTEPSQGEEWFRKAPKITFATDANAEILFSWDGDPPMVYRETLTASEGDHNLTFHARDGAGNTEKARTVNFRVDTHLPVAFFTISAANVLIGESIVVDASGSSDDNGIDLYQLDFGDGYKRSGEKAVEEHIYDAAGTYTVTLKVRDESGAWSDAVSATVTVNLPPRPTPPAVDKGFTLSPSMTMGALLVAIVIGVIGMAASRLRRKPKRGRRRRAT
jgi:hypothetical protein